MLKQKSLSDSLARWFEEELCYLPKPLQARVEEKFASIPWDNLTPEKRRVVASILDTHSVQDARSNDENSEQSALKKALLLHKRTEWSKVPVRNVEQLEKKEARLAALDLSIGRIDLKKQLSRGDFLEVDAKLMRELDGVDGPAPTVNSAPKSPATGKATVRRDVRKLSTEAKHKGWQKEYRKLKKSHPNHTDVWYAKKIANTPNVSLGASADTIRKNMQVKRLP